MQTVALGYGDPATWGGRQPYDENDDEEYVKLSRTERKKRSDTKLAGMLADFKAGKLLSTIFHSYCASIPDRKRFFYECRVSGVVNIYNGV